MSRPHLGSQPNQSMAMMKLLVFVGVSLAIHAVLVVGSSVGFILNGFSVDDPATEEDGAEDAAGGDENGGEPTGDNANGDGSGNGSGNQTGDDGLPQGIQTRRDDSTEQYMDSVHGGDDLSADEINDGPGMDMGLDELE